MKQFPPILLISIFVVAVGCNPTSSEVFEPADITYLDFSYVNEEGKDILDEDTIQFFNIYYLQRNEETGNVERVPARSPQYSFYRHNVSMLITLRVFPNPIYVDDQSTTLIESPQDDIDTLRVQVHLEEKNVIPEIVWYNGEIIWETGPNPQELYFKITKSEP